MYYSNGNYEAFARPKKPQDVENKSAYLVGSGLASLSAALFLVRDAQMPGERIHILEELELPDYIQRDVIDKNGLESYKTTDLLEVMPQLDVLYMTRVQKERFFNEDDYLRLRDSYILTPDKLDTAKKDLKILHPLPRVNEISVKIDEDPRACYFKQVRNGKFIRMALILKLLKEAEA